MYDIHGNSHRDAHSSLREVDQEEKACPNGDGCIAPDGEAASIIIRELVISDFRFGNVEDTVGAIQPVLDFVMLVREYAQGHEGDNHHEKEEEREENVAQPRAGIAATHTPALARLFGLHRLRSLNKRTPLN